MQSKFGLEFVRQQAKRIDVTSAVDATSTQPGYGVKL